MNKNISRFLLSAMLLMCCTVMTWAQETQPNDEIWYTSSNGEVVEPYDKGVFGATIQSNTYNGGKGVIKFNGPVTMIGYHAFVVCTTLRSLTMPNSVTSIGEYAFQACSSLEEITIPGSVTIIGISAFASCSGLKSIVVDEDNKIYDSRDNCNAIIETATNTLIVGCQNTTIPNLVKKIGDYVFQSCTNLQSINIPASVTSIGEYAFQACSSLEEITIPNSVTSIGQRAFAACTGLTSVSVTSGSIESNAFEGCTNLNNVTLHDEKTGSGVTSIGHYAFSGCSKLKSITIPGTVKSMGKYVFSETNLNDVTIEDGAYIGQHAFRHYSGALTVNGSLSGVGQSAFGECTGLTSISVTSGSIGSYAFEGCTNLSTVTLHDETTGSGVTSIGQNAFYRCSKLKSITIPGTVKSMEEYVFSETNLNDVTIEDGAYIGKRCFEYCSGTITINGSLSGVGAYAFQGCTGLTSVSVTSGSIGENAFKGCTNLSTVTLQKDVTGIGEWVFNSCTNLKDIFVKWTEAEKIPSINSYVFNEIDISKVTLHVPTYTTVLYKAKDVWKGFNVYEDINFVITKTDGTTIEQKVLDNGSVTIDESEGNIKNNVVSENAADVSMTYIRNFVNSDKWQGWYVPFDVPLADMTKAGLDVAEIYGILLDNSGNTVIAFLKMEEGTVKANTPYVVRPKTSGKATLTTTTKLYPTKSAQFAINSAKDTYTIGGIYEQTANPGNWYAINKDGQFQKMGTGVGLRPLRIWMTIDSREDNPYATKSGMNMMVISKGQLYEGDL